jgi:hypothetical protein
MPQENVEVVRELIDRSNAGDVSGMLELMSPEIVGFPATDLPESGDPSWTRRVRDLPPSPGTKRGGSAPSRPANS